MAAAEMNEALREALQKQKKNQLGQTSDEELDEVMGEALRSMCGAATQKLPDDELAFLNKLPTDFERMDFVLNQEYVHDILQFEVEIAEKDLEKALKLKDEGNTHFAKKHYVAALEAYNNAVLEVPFGDTNQEKGDDLAIILANRSAALLHIQQYELCLQNIEWSLEAGYPTDKLHKLHDRRGKCYTRLNRSKEAIDCFNLSAELVVSSTALNEKEIEDWKKTLNKQIVYCENLTADPIPPSKKALPALKSRHPIYPQASADITVEHNGTKGRHMKATKRIRVGEILTDEMPFASALFPTWFSHHCYHCSTYVRAPLPDYKCSDLGYCSATCRDLAWNAYHKHEHPIRSLLDPRWCGKLGPLAYRMAVTMGYEPVKQFMTLALAGVREPEPEPLARGLEQDGVFSPGYRAVWALEANMKRRTPYGVWEMHLYAVFLVKVLQKAGYFEGQPGCTITRDTTNNDELLLFACFLLRNLYVVQCNAYGIVELQRPTDFQLPQPADLGYGVYPTAALINHSCNPNADVNYYGNRLFVRATRNILQGEEINIDYGVTFLEVVRIRRRGSLNARFCFECTCPACKGDWRLVRDLESQVPSFRCEKCLRKLDMARDLVDNTSIKCKRCNHLQNVQQSINCLQVMHDKYNEALEAAQRGNLRAAIPQFEDYLQAMQKYLCPPWRDMATCQAAIRQCYRLLANCRAI